MALRDAWWMQSLQKPAPSPFQHEQQDEHREWPWNRWTDGSALPVLEATLQKNPGAACKIDVFSYTGNTRSKWRFVKTLTTAGEVVAMHQPRVCSMTVPS